MNNARPELAIVTQNPDDLVMISLVSQFLENEVFLQPGENQNLLADLPADLEAYKAIAFDQASFETAMKDERTRQRLINYASKDGFILCMKPIPVVNLRDFNVMLMNDHLTFTQAHDLILCAGLTRFNPALRRVQLARSDEQILAEIKPRLLKSVETWEGWHEFNLYYFKSAIRLMESGHAEAREALIAGVRHASKNIPTALNHDYMAGYFATAWLFDQTGERGPLDRAIANSDEVLARRPRNMGVITSCGFEDDPLGLKLKSVVGLEAFYDTNWNTGRRLLWTEGMLMYGPAYAALARVTGNKKYRDEVERLLTHLEQHHIRPDGLLWHCTREGKPGGGAWGRGQTHALLGILFVMDELQQTDPLHARCAEFIRRVGRALLPHQDKATGMWRNLIDAPLSRLESSGTTLFAMIFARGINQGWLDRAEFEQSVRRAWDGIKTRYWRGKVAGWCRGTAAAVDDAYYLMRPQGGSSGASAPQLLWVLLEMQRLNKK